MVISMTPVTRKGMIMRNVLYSSIVWVESKGNENAKSKDGSVGIVQIKPVMVHEVNRICKLRGIDKHYSLRDRLNPEKSEEMFWAFQEFYHPNLNYDSLSHTQMESIARTWNGGPRGPKKKATKRYWRRVLAQIDIHLQNKNLTSLN